MNENAGRNNVEVTGKQNVIKHNIMAAIDIGSYSIRMKIADVDSNGAILPLESARKFINSGKDTFTTGKIKYELLEEICGILKNYKKLINEYDADKYMVVATSSFREAENCDYLQDYVYQKTGLKIEVISESQEKFYTYGSIVDSLANFHELKEEGVLITDVGSGGVEIALFIKGELAYTQYVKLGALRLKEITRHLERRTLSFPNLIGEYIESEIDTLKIMLEENHIKNYLAIGQEIHVVHEILDKGKDRHKRTHLSRDAFYKVYHQIIGKSQQQIIEGFGLNSENAETLVPALLMYEKFLSFTKSEKIYTPDVSLCDGMIRYLTDMRFDLDNKAFSENDIVISVRRLGERYHYDSKHAAQAEAISLLLFDNSKKLHGYSDRERLYLQIAAITHDIGKYINIKDHNLLSQDILLNSDILGLSKGEVQIIANIIRYHANNMPAMSDPNYRQLDFESRIMVSKLAAFLKIADSMDRSHKQKLSNIKVTISEQTYAIKAETSRDSLLEEWEFEKKSVLFTDVYGLKPTLTIKRK
ncbi:MAG: HD domain-containing protein [Clostridiales bacterium]|nr:HD domain-containing protein [Clostridiales bacterium]